MLSVFLRDGEDVYRTYRTTARGVDRVLFVNNILPPRRAAPRPRTQTETPRGLHMSSK